jgi:hypothetical protein
MTCLACEHEQYLQIIQHLLDEGRLEDAAIIYANVVEGCEDCEHSGEEDCLCPPFGVEHE